jgi:glycine dehydrogenase
MAYTLENHDLFKPRHIGITDEEQQQMLATIGVQSLDELIDQTVPDNIRMEGDLDLPTALPESEYLRMVGAIAAKNLVYRSYIGQGYYGTVVPSVLSRNIFQNPGWYTQYTPYQAEIAQGRLEALLNFQTMVSDLTGLPVANASLLDEGTAAAEAMTMFYGIANRRSKDHEINRFFVSDQVFAHTLDVLITRAKPVGIEIVVGDVKDFDPTSEAYFGVLLQYPGKSGLVEDYADFAARCREAGLFVTVAADLLSLAILKAPGAWGADAVVGNTQRFGVPMGFGGPHAAYFATSEEHKRQIPGRIIGVSVDSHGNPALRMALQTREQHIRREKATSNICTAQALLAIMAGMYAAYHGPHGIRAIATRVHQAAVDLAGALAKAGRKPVHSQFFDTIVVPANAEEREAVRKAALEKEINFLYTDAGVQLSLDETVSAGDIEDIAGCFSRGLNISLSLEKQPATAIPDSLKRVTPYLTHPVFNSYQTETKMMRYLKRLENKDLSLVHSMISLGSCTMKLNAASELIPVSWPEFADIHPFAPVEQTEGYRQIITELEAYLCEITGFTACSLQPNSGAQGEYAGLLTIRAYHESRGEGHRHVALIPSSAHGTNPASAVMAGMDVVVVPCDDKGNIQVDKLRELAEKHADNLSCLMVTYPSTHGVFEKSIVEICDIVHRNGGKVYMDGANMNAQVGLTSPGLIKADVCHLNLHKTFAIPHGGGGPGMGPICVNDSLAPFLPGHNQRVTGGDQAIPAVSSAPFGSASILLISYGYIRMLGTLGCTAATKAAILNANYIQAKIKGHYDVLYTGEFGRVAHELIVDLRPFKDHVSVEDVAKRLVDYGFHSPTMSFPVAGTIMIEPTESESMSELDRFCEALLAIREEIRDIASGKSDASDNPLVNAPHTCAEVTASAWSHPYSREKAAYPLAYLGDFKYWAPVGRVNNAHGDRNLICTCPPIEAYQDEMA